jgi:hypothetical protein
MADAFNKFFSSIGSNIANSIPPTEVDPLSYITLNNYSNLLDLGNTGLILVCDIITLCKNSLDLDGMSTNLIKSTVGAMGLARRRGKMRFFESI